MPEAEVYELGEGAYPARVGRIAEKLKSGEFGYFIEWPFFLWVDLQWIQQTAISSWPPPGMKLSSRMKTTRWAEKILNTKLKGSSFNTSDVAGKPCQVVLKEKTSEAGTFLNVSDVLTADINKRPPTLPAELLDGPKFEPDDGVPF